MAQSPTPSARHVRTLPARPSLEHLKNEAKQRLKALRTQNPQAKLASAQLALARDYGFASCRLLKAHPELIDARGGGFWGRAALHMAAWRKQPACVRLLLQRGADVRIRDYGDNAYALHFAAEAGDLTTVKALVEAGSDVIGEG